MQGGNKTERRLSCSSIKIFECIENSEDVYNNKVLFNSIEIKEGEFSLCSLGSKVRLICIQYAKKHSHCATKYTICQNILQGKSEHVKNKVLMLHRHKSKTKEKVDRMWRRMDPAVL